MHVALENNAFVQHLDRYKSEWAIRGLGGKGRGAGERGEGGGGGAVLVVGEAVVAPHHIGQAQVAQVLLASGRVDHVKLRARRRAAGPGPPGPPHAVSRGDQTCEHATCRPLRQFRPSRGGQKQAHERAPRTGGALPGVLMRRCTPRTALLLLDCGKMEGRGGVRHVRHLGQRPSGRGGGPRPGGRGRGGRAGCARSRRPRAGGT